MYRKNENRGPCAIINCRNTELKFKTITDLALDKLQQCPDYESVNYLKKNDQICQIHYMKYVEFNKYKKRARNDETYEEISRNNDNIRINVTESGILLSKEDFGSLIEKIGNLESIIEKKNDQIEEIENLIDVNSIYLTVQQQLEKSEYSNYTIIYLLHYIVLILFFHL